jgi:hypothetical protein
MPEAEKEKSRQNLNTINNMSYQNQILGTIISSALNYDQLNDLIGEKRGCTPSSSYAPCDGRSVSDSKLANILIQNTGAPNVPDLRGAFVRGLNEMHLEGQPPLDILKSDPDGLNRKAGDYQPDILLAHNHPANGHINGSVCGSNGTRDCDGGDEKFNCDPSFGDHTVIVNVAENVGGQETRPRNVAVYFYIKIN